MSHVISRPRTFTPKQAIAWLESLGHDHATSCEVVSFARNVGDRLTPDALIHWANR